MSLRIYLFLVNLIRKISFLHRAIWLMRLNYHRTRRNLLIRKPLLEAGPLLKDAIKNRKPYAVGKMGSIEALATWQALKRKKAFAEGRKVPSYSPYIFHTLFINSGVFPQDDKFFDAFALSYLDAVSACDVLVAWDVAGETDILRSYAKEASLVKLYSLDSFLADDPWTAVLCGKKVLVISPFVDSIQSQFARRETLWDNPNVLPLFELILLRAPFSAGLVSPKDADWFAAVDLITKEMDSCDYDVTLIGAGAFSLPLAVHAKKNGKVGVHLGGSLQFLFGVYGERWLRSKMFRQFVKDTWIRPQASERPERLKKIEDGCYW